MEDAMRAAVVGAGLSGLSAAYRLRSKGIDPVVFEAGPHAGGRAGSERVNGFLVDKGAYTIPAFHRAFMGLAREAGVSGELRPTPGTASTFCGDREFRMKVGSVKDILTHRLFTTKAKVGLARLFLAARAPGMGPAFGRESERTRALEMETAAHFLQRKYGRDILETVAVPMVSELFLDEPENLSAASFLTMLRMPVRFRIYAFGQGMGALADALRQGLDVRFETPVLRISGDPQAGPFEVQTGGKGAGSESFDRVVLATPLPLVPGLIPQCPDAVSRALSGVAYVPSVVAALGLERPPAAGSMINALLRTEHPTVATVVFDHLKGPGRVPAGRGLITAILTAPASAALFEASDEEITRAVQAELSGLWKEARSGLMFSRVFRWPYGAVRQPPGSLSRARDLRRVLEGWSSRLVIAGDGLFQASMEVAVKTGFRAADRILKAR